MRIASGLLRNTQLISGPGRAPNPRIVHANPQASVSEGGDIPLPTSSINPNTPGLITPAPNPITERTAKAAPMNGGSTSSVIEVEKIEESAIEDRL